MSEKYIFMLSEMWSQDYVEKLVQIKKLWNTRVTGAGCRSERNFLKCTYVFELLENIISNYFNFL